MTDTRVAHVETQVLGRSNPPDVRVAHVETQVLGKEASVARVAHLEVQVLVPYSGGAPVPAGPSWRVWNGTTEVAATVTVWNGTAEVATTTEIV